MIRDMPVIVGSTSAGGKGICRFLWKYASIFRCISWLYFPATLDMDSPWKCHRDNILESRKENILSSILGNLKCSIKCSTLLSFLSRFCFYILKIMNWKVVLSMDDVGPRIIVPCRFICMAFSNEVQTMVGGGQHFLCTQFSWYTLQMCCARFLCKKECALLTSWKTSFYSQNPSYRVSVHLF